MLSLAYIAKALNLPVKNYTVLREYREINFFGNGPGHNRHFNICTAGR
jgi:hypothetical protein